VTVLVWRWGRCADPDQPCRKQTKRERLPHAPTIQHPLADRVGETCELLAQSSTNGNRLVRFPDGLTVVAPFYATRAPTVDIDGICSGAGPGHVRVWCVACKGKGVRP